MISRPSFCLRTVDHAEFVSLPDPFAALRAGEYGGLLVRGVFEQEEIRGAVDRLEAAPAYRDVLFPGSTIEFVGRPLQWSGADLSAYLAAASRLEEAWDRLLPEGVRLLDRIYGALQQIAGGPVRVFRGAGGPYAPVTLRRFPPGAEVGPHFELGQLEAPSYAELIPCIDAAAIFSFFLLLSAPEQGGELAVYDLCWGDADAEAVRSGACVEDPLLGRYEPRYVVPAAGDLLIFNSGRHAHRVLPVRGARARWTAGGLLARARDGGEMLAWA